MVSVRLSGSFDGLEKWLRKLTGKRYLSVLEHYAQIGVEALSSATPVDTGKTAASWRYEIEDDGDVLRINYHNDNVNDGVVIAVILQYGHGTGTGGYVQGRDYITPAIRPTFDQIMEAMWREVTDA